jgi:hypothetical protein
MFELVSYYSGQVAVRNSFEQSNEPSGSVKDKEI